MNVDIQSSKLISKLTQLIEKEISKSTSIPIIGLSGPQGSGKSTALKYIAKRSPYKITGLSLDDFYLTKSARKTLSKKISPLFETRGPAGTHDLSLLEITLSSLQNAKPESICPIPKFDKPSDERLPIDMWDVFKGRPDAIILEGWMIGATPPPGFLTSPPLNDIEHRDSSKTWRREQFDKLSGPYSDLWDCIDSFIHIIGPGFETVKNWRLEQEATNLQMHINDLPQARCEWVSSFVQYFERLTNSMHAGHVRSGTLLRIDENRDYIAEQRKWP